MASTRSSRGRRSTDWPAQLLPPAITVDNAGLLLQTVLPADASVRFPGYSEIADKCDATEVKEARACDVEALFDQLGGVSKVLSIRTLERMILENVMRWNQARG